MPEEESAGSQSVRLKQDVASLAVAIGPRNIYHYGALREAADYIETSLRSADCVPVLQEYESRGRSFVNISVELLFLANGGEERLLSCFQKILELVLKVFYSLDWHFGYPIAIVLMILAAALPYYLFKWKKWL